MNPGEDQYYSEQVKNIEDSGSEKDSVCTRPSLAPLWSDHSEVNKSSKSDCLDDIELNRSSKASKEIELEDLDLVFWRQYWVKSIVEIFPKWWGRPWRNHWFTSWIELSPSYWRGRARKKWLLLILLQQDLDLVFWRWYWVISIVEIFPKWWGRPWRNHWLTSWIELSSS